MADAAAVARERLRMKLELPVVAVEAAMEAAVEAGVAGAGFEAAEDSAAVDG